VDGSNQIEVKGRNYMKLLKIILAMLAAFFMPYAFDTFGREKP